MDLLIDWWTWIRTSFPNRQIAFTFWMLVAASFCLCKSSVRSSIGGVIRASLAPKLLLLFGSMILNVCGLVYLFTEVGVWKSDQLAATLVWTLSGLLLLGKALSTSDEGYFRNLLLGCFKATVIVEFLIVGYSFSLPIELIFVPLMTLVGALIEASRIDEDRYFPIKRILEWVTIIVVGVVLWKSVGRIWDDPGTFFTTKTGRNFVLPGLLTIASIPLLYFWHCYSSLEIAWIRIDFKSYQSDALKRYAKTRFFLTFGLRPELLKRATRQFQSAHTKGDVDQIISEIHVHERYRRNPPQVDERLGWSPYLARDFLASEGLRTSDYHRAWGEDQWWANSGSVELQGGIFANRATFCVEGSKELATVLKLKGEFNRKLDVTLALERFEEIATLLLVRSGTTDGLAAETVTGSGQEFRLEIGRTSVEQKLEEYPNPVCFALTLVLVRGAPGSA